MNRRQLFAALLSSLALGVATTARAADTEKNPINSLEQQRYKQNPVYIVFESYILDVIGHLPPDKSKTIQSMNLRKVF